MEDYGPPKLGRHKSTMFRRLRGVFGTPARTSGPEPITSTPILVAQASTLHRSPTTNNMFSENPHRDPPPSNTSPSAPARNVSTTVTPKPTPKSAPTFRVTAPMIRHLRAQILLRYSLDMAIWNRGRRAKIFARDPTKEKMRRSDALLLEIQGNVRDWDNRAYFADEASYATFCEIRRRVEEGGKRVWRENPPWGGRAGTGDGSGSGSVGGGYRGRERGRMSGGGGGGGGYEEDEGGYGYR